MQNFNAVMIKDANDQPVLSTELCNIQMWPAGEVTIAVDYSSLNYKDALACQGHRGVVKSLPHVPGIDAVGTVAESAATQFRPGDRVVVTGYDLGQGSFGGWSEFIRVPASWVVRLPERLSPREAMILGTAGFTAAQCVRALRRNDCTPQSGPVVVTGATGGVGSLAVSMLHNLGYEVVAVSGKPAQTDWLKSIGASSVMTRAEIAGAAERPLLSAKWGGGVDTVGGDILTSILKSTRYGGAVTSCGLVAGSDLSMTLYPFLLRGINLCGIASADCPMDVRLEIWQQLASELKPVSLSLIANEINFEGLSQAVASILGGGMIGRTLVKVAC